MVPADPAERAAIKQYVDKAFIAKLMQMNEERDIKKRDLKVQLAHNGISLNSSGWVLGAIGIEEECIAELLRQKGDLYLDAYQRKGLRVGPDVLKDIAFSQAEIIAARKQAVLREAGRFASINQQVNSVGRGLLGKKASIAMKEIEAKIDLYNLTTQRVERQPMTVNNITYHLAGTGNRVVHGDDSSVNVINEAELFQRLTSVIESAVEDVSARQDLLEKLQDLNAEKNRTDYLTKLTRFMGAAAGIAHLIAPYLPGLAEKANSLF